LDENTMLANKSNAIRARPMEGNIIPTVLFIVISTDSLFFRSDVERALDFQDVVLIKAMHPLLSRHI